MSQFDTNFWADAMLIEYFGGLKLPGDANYSNQDN